MMAQSGGARPTDTILDLLREASTTYADQAPAMLRRSSKPPMLSSLSTYGSGATGSGRTTTFRGRTR